MQVSARMEDEQGPFLVVFTDEPGPCGHCRRLTAWFVLRVGSVRCWACDALETLRKIKANAARLI